jgi:hypothetical protein
MTREAVRIEKARLKAKSRETLWGNEDVPALSAPPTRPGKKSPASVASADLMAMGAKTCLQAAQQAAQQAAPQAPTQRRPG